MFSSSYYYWSTTTAITREGGQAWIVDTSGMLGYLYYTTKCFVRCVRDL